MNHNSPKILSNMDIFNTFGRKNNMPIEFNKDIQTKLKTNLIVSPTDNAYSCCIEYMSKWFYSKFPDNFFKSTYLDSSHILPLMKKLSTKDMVIPSLPAANITPDLDFAFNRENLDLHNFGLNMYNNRCSYRDSFFIDKDRDLYVSCTMEMLLMRFSFRILLPYKGIQLNTAKLCQMAFRSNGTQKHFNDLDYLIPSELIDQIAEDAGYTIDPNDFVSITNFLKYLNSNSKLPFFYKLNLSTGNMDWYVKMSNVIIHIRTDEVNIDQGERKSQKNTNYTVSFDCQVRFPSPKFFAYYTLVENNLAKRIKKIDKKSFAITVEDLSKIPSKDEHGWEWTVQTDYMFDSPKEVSMVKKGEPGLEIHFEELIGSLRDVIDYTKSIAISPEIFLNIKVFNFDQIIDTHIDWNTYTIIFDEGVESCKCILLIYMDNNYFNDTLSKMRGYKENRIQPSQNNIGADISSPTKQLTHRS